MAPNRPRGRAWSRTPVPLLSRSSRRLYCSNTVELTGQRRTSRRPGGQADSSFPAVVPVDTRPAGLGRYRPWDGNANVPQEHVVDLARGTHLARTPCRIAITAYWLPRPSTMDAPLHRHFRNAMEITRAGSDFGDVYFGRLNAAHPAQPMGVVFNVGATRGTCSDHRNGMNAQLLLVRHWMMVAH